MTYFSLFHFLCQHKVLCGISDNFPWQTIWDLSKKISALQKSLLLQPDQKSQICHFCVIYLNFMPSQAHIWCISDFSCFVSAQGALWDLGQFSLTNNLRLVKTNCGSAENFSPIIRSQITKHVIIHTIFVFLCRFET